MCIHSIQRGGLLEGQSLSRVCLRSCFWGLMFVLYGGALAGCKPANNQDASLAFSSKAHWQDFLAKQSEPAAGQVDRSVATDVDQGEIKPNGSVGSVECIECHQEQSASYEQTSHHHAARWIADSTRRGAAQFVHQPTGRVYEVDDSDGRVEHRERIVGLGGELIATVSAAPVLEVGSGLHAHSYLTQRDGWWIQSPLTWYSGPQQWELSPGFDPGIQPTFQRVINTNCVFCHVGQIHAGKDLNHFKILEVSIGCERCHGPGRDHVNSQRAATQNGDRKSEAPENVDGVTDIIHPMNLSREASEAICAQCHLQGKVSCSASGFQRWDFVPGDLLSDSITEYQPVGVDEGFKIVGHTEQLHASACYLQTDTLTCITCHDPHAGRPSIKEYRQVCVGCHQVDGCSVPEIDRIRMQHDDCNHCHMPVRSTNVPHAALTDHRIAVHDSSYTLAAMEPPASRSDRQESPRLAAISDESSLEPWRRERRWAIAMHSLAFQDSVPTALVPDLARARKTLLDLFREGVADPSLQVFLAKDYLAANMLGPANQLATRIVSETNVGESPYVGAADVLGQLALRAEDNQLALHWYRQLTKLRRVSGDFFLLGLCESNTGDRDAAMRAFEQALRIDPTLLPAHEHLARLLEEMGHHQRSRLHFDLIRGIRVQPASNGR